MVLDVFWVGIQDLTWNIVIFGARQRWALGKVPGRLTAAAVVPFAERQMLGTRQRMVLCRLPACRALGKSYFAECPIWLSAKLFYFFLFFDLSFFVRLFDTVSNPILKFERSLTFFAIFDWFNLFLCVFLDNSNLKYTYMKYRNAVFQKMIFMVLYIFWVRI